MDRQDKLSGRQSSTPVDGRHSDPRHVFDLGLSLLTALCASGQVLLVRVGSQYGGVRESVLLSMLVNAVIFLPAALLIEYPDYGLTPVSIVAFASAGLAGTLLRMLFYFVSTKRIGAGGPSH